jgi:alpha-L-fucosidase 2
MKFIATISTPLLAAALMTGGAWAADSPSDTLVYGQPATPRRIDKEALPIGNGTLGGMLMGGTAEETVQVNVDTLWNGDETAMGAYQNLGFVKIRFDGIDAKAVKNYRRALHIDTAVHETTFDAAGVRHRRTAFSSAPDQVLVLSFAADKPLSGTIALEDDLSFIDKHPPFAGAKKVPTGKMKKAKQRGRKRGNKKGVAAVEAKKVPVLGYESRKSSHIAAEGRVISLDGVLANGLEYGARLLARCTDGSISADGKTLRFKDARNLEILFVAETNYKMSHQAKWRGASPAPILGKRLAAAAGKNFETLKKSHIADYKSYYDRARIDLGTTPPEIAGLATDKRLERFKKEFAKTGNAPAASPDIDLEELIANYGRYLIISSSRPGTLPANLQGLWNWTNAPAWQSDYHSNINVQMNYWLAEPNGLGDCHTAFLDFIMAMRDVYLSKTPKDPGTHPNGKPIKRGWTLRTGTNPFGASTFKWNHPAAAWYAQHLWEHYAFNEDKDFLAKTAYPVFKETVQFWEDRLDERPDGTLVVPDGWSPEHGPTEPGVSYDQEIVYDIFTNYIEAASILGVDADYRAHVADMRKRLLKPKIGSWGQLQEWETDRDDKNDHHRHASHLFALHPGRQISPLTTPKLAKAAQVSLEARGDGGTGWSKAWKINFWARLHDGEHAHKILCEQITHNFFPNLFDFHPPFQIDGNFGNTSGVTEMLVQSHMRAKPAGGDAPGPWIVQLLPTLPKAWRDGSARGLRARGGLTVDMEWSGGVLKQATIRGKAGKRIPISYAGKQSMHTIPGSGKLVFVP